MRDYGKIFSTIWESADFRSLSEDGRTLVLYLLSCKHNTIAGVFRLPDGYACEDLQWTQSRVAEGFAELAGRFADRCETTKWVWVRKFLEWNPPENPNQRKAVLKVASTVPTQCAWTRAFMRVCGPSLGLEPEPTEEELDKGCETVSQPETETGTEAGTGVKPSASSAGPTIPCPYQQIVDCYHDRLPMLPRVKLMPASRQKALRKLWGWVLSSSKSDGARRATTAMQALEWIDGYFTRASENDFLAGRVQRTGEHANWRCDLDFLLTEKGMKHVIEKTQEAA
jgi:hypothetical protein